MKPARIHRAGCSLSPSSSPGANVKKVRGASDETDALIRLADAVCGFVRAALEGQSDMRTLFDEQVRLGVVREVGRK